MIFLVFSSYDYSIKTDKKPHHYFYFNGGKSYFYIPPFPFRGEGTKTNNFMNLKILFIFRFNKKFRITIF